MKKTMIRVSAIVLAIIIMLCPLSVCIAAADPVPTPNVPEVLGNDELYRQLIYYYIWTTLRSWGINIQYSSFTEYAGDIGQWIDENLEAWLDTVPSINSIDALLFPWKFIWNPSGYLVGNHSALDDIRKFGDWLVSHYGLTDNNSQQVEANVNVIDELVVYSFPFIYSNTAGTQGVEVTVVSSTTDTYFAVRGTVGTGTYSIYPISHGTATVKLRNYYTSGSSDETNYQLVQYNSNWYVNEAMPGMSRGYFNGYQVYTLNYIRSILNSNNSVESYGSNMYIITNTIDIPSSETIEDNSIVITPEGPLYEPVDWAETISVDNLPAIVSTGTIQNPGIESVFLPIKAFITTFSDGIGLMTQLVYNMPSEIVGMALAIMSGIIVFGVIRIMKEH